MAYQFGDGFDNYGNSYALIAGYPWDYLGQQGSGSQHAGTSNTSTADYRFAPPGSLPGGCVIVNQNNFLRKNLVGTPGTLYFTFAFKLTTLPESGVGGIFDFWDNGNYQCCLTVSSTGALQFYRGNGLPPGGGGSGLQTAIGTASAGGTVTNGVWYGVNLAITISTTVGSHNIILNGNSVLSNSSLNNSGTGNAYATQVSLGTTNYSACKYDDFCCWDNTGAFFNSALSGDSRIFTKLTSGAGQYTNWTPTNPTNVNWSNVNTLPPSATKYNSNNTVTTKDSYAVQSAGLSVAPYLVWARASLDMNDAGPHTPSLFMRSGSTDSAGVATAALTSGFLFYDAVFQNDPATSSPWAGAAADAAQVGIIEG